MFSLLKSLNNSFASLKTTATLRRLAAAIAIVMLSSVAPARAAYTFLPVSGFSSGNTTFAQFTSLNGNGIIPVSHSFSAGGVGPDDNNNALLFPSNYSAIPGFAGTGNVQGHLAQTQYGNTSVVTFLMTGYNISTANTVFGMWNTTDEVAQPPYRIELIINNNPVAPTTFTTFGTGDNLGAGQPLGRHQMVLNPATGNISAGGQINQGNGIHTNALFWTGIPSNTQMIKVYGTLGAITGNNQGDGVGYYFAELAVPEPASCTLIGLGILSVGICVRRRK